MRLRVIVFALVATAVAAGLVLPSAGAKPNPIKPGQYITYKCGVGATAGSATVAWLDNDGRVVSVARATASGATLTAGPAPNGPSTTSSVASSASLRQRPPRSLLTRPFISQESSVIRQMASLD
jgi:hypothetical protein